VAAAGGDQLAVGTEGDGVDGLGVPVEGAQLAAAGDVPDFHGTVLAAADQARAVGAVGDGVDGGNGAELGGAEDAGDVFGEVGGEAGDLPAGLAVVVAGFEHAAGGQGGLGAGGEGVGTGAPFRREFFAEAGGVGGGAFGLELGLQVADLVGGEGFRALG